MAAIRRSSVQDKIADVTECSICTEIFANPKVLPCVHTFCLHCLESYGKEMKPGDQMVCPICRKKFHIPDGGFSNLPSNFFIGKMVEIGKLTMTQKNKELCALCPQDDEVLAQLFCVDCEQNLCSRCGNGHRKSRFSQHHQIVELGSQLNAPEINLRNSYCDHHPGEQIKMFCYEDNVAICLVCCVESHQSHRCVNVNKAAGEFTENLKNSMRKVANRLPECEEVATKLDKFKKEFEEEVFKAEEGFRDATTQLKKLIDQHTDILVRNLKLLREQNLKAFEITKQDVDRFKVMIDSYSRYSEELLARGSPVDVCRAASQMLTRGRELEMLPANCSGDCFRCDSVSFHCSNIVDFLEQYGKTIAVGELTVTQPSQRCLKFLKETSDERESELSECREERKGKLSEKPVRKFEESFRGESPVRDSCVIDVQGIPDTFTDNLVTMIFENRRCCGIAGVEVAQVEMLEGGRAQLTIKEPQHAKALIDSGSIKYKNHTFVISRPSKPEPVEDVSGSLQHPSSNEQLNVTPGENATRRKDLICEGATIDASNIPEDMAEETLKMIFESKRFGGGCEVTNIVYEKGQGSAVITLLDPGVARRLVLQATLVFKGSRLAITRHVEKDRSQQPFSSRKPNNVPTIEKKQPSISDRTITVSNIPSDVSNDTLEMIFENARNGGGYIDNVVYDQAKGTAVITFKDPEVAEALIDKGSLRYWRHKLTISRPSKPEPVADQKESMQRSTSAQTLWWRR